MNKDIKYINYLTYLTIFTIPLKLTITYTLAVPLIVLMIKNYDSFQNKELEIPNYLKLFYLYLFSTFIFSIFGFNPLASSIEFFSYLSKTIFIFIILLNRSLNYKWLFSSLIFGQTIASFHSILESLKFLNLEQLFVGTVTESGQLSITIVLVIGFLLLHLKNNKIKKTNYLFFFISIISLVFVGFDKYLLNFNDSKFIFVLITTPLILFFLNFLKQKKVYFNDFNLIVAIPYLFTALLVNLKRGPLVGVILSIILLLFIYRKKLILPFLSLIIVVFILIAPFRERILSSYNHFIITGGRGAIWHVGYELLKNNPLGIGFKNSQIVNKYSLDIPEELEHFHSNILNITVESGWIALCLYLFFIISFLKYTIKKENILLTAVGASVLSIQVAGLVEHNLGDSEVLLIFYLLLGTASKIKENKI